MTDVSASDPEPHSLRKTVLGVAAGGALFVAIMLLLAGSAVAFGWIRSGQAGGVNLVPWLTIEIVGGAAASMIGGAVSRHIAGCYRGPAVLAVIVSTIGLLEAIEIHRSTAIGSAAAPTWLVFLAPIVAAVGVLIGGSRFVMRIVVPRRESTRSA